MITEEVIDDGKRRKDTLCNSEVKSFFSLIGTGILRSLQDNEQWSYGFIYKGYISFQIFSVSAALWENEEIAWQVCHIRHFASR